MARDKKSVQCYVEDHETVTNLAKAYGETVPDLMGDAVRWLAASMAGQPTKAERQAARRPPSGTSNVGSTGVERTSESNGRQTSTRNSERMSAAS